MAPPGEDKIRSDEDAEAWRLSTWFVPRSEAGIQKVPHTERFHERITQLLRGEDPMARAQTAFETISNSHLSGDDVPYREARAVLADVARQDPKNYFALMGLLLIATRERNFGKIGQLADQLLSEYSEDPEAYMLAAVAYISIVSDKDPRAGDVEHKLETLARARECINRRSAILRENGQNGRDRFTLMRLGDIERMERNIRLAVRAKSRGAGRPIHHRSGSVVFVSPAYRETVLNPVEEMKGVRASARKLVTEKKFAEAKPLLEKLISTGTAGHAVLVWKFLVAIHENDINEAHRMFERVKWNMPREVASRYVAALHFLEEKLASADYDAPSKGGGSGMFAGDALHTHTEGVNRGASLTTWDPKKNPRVNK